MLDQFRGCLLGSACGDALGAPLEGLAAAEIAQRHGKVREMLGGGWLKLKPGETTDDTELMLCVAESYLACGAFDPLDIAERFLEWSRSGPRDIGSVTRLACENLDYGYDFERSGYEAWRELPDGMRMGNGSLPRAAPTGLVRYHDHVHLVGESRVVSGITHYDERCKLACVCVSLALAHLMLVGVDGLLDELLEFVGPRNTVIAYSLQGIPSLRVDDLPSGGNVLDTLQVTLWAALYCDEFEEGLLLLANRGADADTVGAVGGALLGARFGAKAIPERWLGVLQHRRRLDEAAQGLYEMSQRE
jgi:ADP-ribosyl-[dinitrogen reductase] hydrolase